MGGIIGKVTGRPPERERKWLILHRIPIERFAEEAKRVTGKGCLPASETGCRLIPCVFEGKERIDADIGIARIIMGSPAAQERGVVFSPYLRKNAFRIDKVIERFVAKGFYGREGEKSSSSYKS